MSSYSRPGVFSPIPGPGSARTASRIGPAFAIPAFLAIGAVASWYALPLLERLGPIGASAAVLVLPVVAIVALAGFRKAIYKWREFRGLLTSWHWLWFFVLASGFILRIRDSINARQEPADAAALFRV